MSTNEAQKQNPALEAFQIFIGEWTTTGTHPYMPGTTFHGRTSFAWLEGGAFMVIHSQIDEEGIPSGISILGSDDTVGTFYILYFDERGVSRKLDVTIQGRAMRWSRDTPEFSQHMVLTMSEDGKTIEAKGEMSKDGGAWEPDLALTYTRN